MVSILLGTAIGLYLSVLKLVYGITIGNRPLLILGVVLFLAGVQLFSVGLLAELLMRTYHESQGRPIYRVREVVGTDHADRAT
jgi:dolichol-phosphate mannosyltransferase